MTCCILRVTIIDKYLKSIYEQEKVLQEENMSDANSEIPQVERFEPQTRNDNDNMIVIVSIIAVCVVSLACILSCTLMAYMFFSNPPW